MKGDKMNGYSFLSELDLPWTKLADANVLVTGATGLIASNFVEALLSVNADLGLNMRVYALCRRPDAAVHRFERTEGKEALSVLVQDVVDFENPGVDFKFVIHAASSACPDAFNVTPVDVMKANFIGTLKLLESGLGNNKMRFLFVSSSEVYGENEEGVERFYETDNGSVNFARFRACYPESKRASETLCMSFAKQYGMDVVIVRPAFIFGAEIADSNTRADAYFMRQALAGKDIIMNSKGCQIRSYLYVKDCVSAMLYAMLLGESGCVYNIGDDSNAVSLRNYAQALANAGGVFLRYEADAESAQTVFLKTMRCVLDTTKIRELGWRPLYGLDRGIEEIFSRKREEIS